MSKAIKASWNIELHCKCPNCGEHVDLLAYPDFWDGRRLQAGEVNTPASTETEVGCPHCRAEFLATFGY